MCVKQKAVSQHLLHKIMGGPLSLISGKLGGRRIGGAELPGTLSSLCLDSVTALARGASQGGLNSRGKMCLFATYSPRNIALYLL